MNRTQAVVIGFVTAAWLALIAVLTAQPNIYDAQLQDIELAGQPLVRLAFVAAVGLVLLVLVIGALRRWRWTFWLMLIASASGVIRLPLSSLQIFGVLPRDVPQWYAGLQALVGGMQMLIAAAMLLGYRRSGPWARSRSSQRRYRPRAERGQPYLLQQERVLAPAILARIRPSSG